MLISSIAISYVHVFSSMKVYYWSNDTLSKGMLNLLSSYKTSEKGSVGYNLSGLVPSLHAIVLWKKRTKGVEAGNESINLSPQHTYQCSVADREESIAMVN